ncbi:ATP-binding protein [Burkholderia sp. Leaf177]|uniref:ATP-binding protein n=1 Tax=Burkholderia sp. Leaf177 TaxID=1736287 RepID=UPI0009E6A575|nr:ATP-binding protein [Burkholderia sp. Leaf177]
MDGVERRVGQSLQLRLSKWLAIAVLLSAVAAGIFSFQAAFHEANDIQDLQLKEVAALVTADNAGFMEEGSARYVPDFEREAKVVVQRLGGHNAQRLLDLPPTLPDGIQTLRLDDHEWRIVVRTLAPGVRVGVGQQTSDRNEIARNSAVATLIPFVVLAPVLVGVVFLLVRHMFKPLLRLAAELDARPDHDLSEIRVGDDAQLPAEIVPFLVANNRLLARVAQSVALQRRFVADAAHELRSPLTVLLLQAERLDLSEMSTQARERFTALRNGLMRTRALVEQLLTLAHVQEANGVEASQTPVAPAFRRVLEDLVPLAQARHIDIGVTGDADTWVPASEADLATILKNLVDNAIRYTPEGGRVDLSVRADSGNTSIVVEDTGPGIPADERDRVFDRFYRVLGTGQNGSGLGLSIVQTIANRIDARVTLDDAAWPDGRSGLRVTLTFHGNAGFSGPGVQRLAKTETVA